MEESRARMTNGYLAVEGGQLYYEVSGTGYPLVLIHAAVADHTMWENQVKTFAQNYQVITYDVRGYGKSSIDRGEEPVSYSETQDLVDLLKHLGVEQAVVLGLSHGGEIAINFTLEFPAMVKALVAVAAAFDGLEADGTEAEWAAFREEQRLQEAKEYDLLAELGAKYWVDGPVREPAAVRDEVREQIFHYIFDNSQRLDGPSKKRALTPPAGVRLGEISVPTLVMWGDQDESTIQAAGAKLATDVKAAQKSLFTDTAHMINLEHPEQFNQVLKNFLGQLDISR